ncbi:hypothetical protein AAC387_Pa03g1015 [Persea americana]
MTEPMRSQVDHWCRSKWVLLGHRSAEGHRRSEIVCLFGKIREELQRILNFKPEKNLGDADRCLKEKDLDSQPRHCWRRQERLGAAVLGTVHRARRRTRGVGRRRIKQQRHACYLLPRKTIEEEIQDSDGSGWRRRVVEIHS